MKRKLAISLSIVLVAGVIAVGCGKKETSPENTESAAEETELSSEDLEAESETVIEESVKLDEIKTAYEEAEETDPDASYEVDENSASTRKDGSVVVQAKDESGNTVVLIYADEESYKAGKGAVQAPSKEVEQAAEEVAVAVQPSKGAQAVPGENKGNSSQQSSSAGTPVAGNQAGGSTVSSANKGNSSGNTASKPQTPAAEPTPAETTAAPQPTVPETTAAPTKSQEEILLEEYNSISTDQIRAWYLQGFNAKRAALGLGPVPENAILNAQAQAQAEYCAAYGMQHSTSGNFGFESISPCGRYEVLGGDLGGLSSGVETYDGNAIWFGADGGYAHCPDLYTADTQAMGIGVARRPATQDFFIVIQGVDSETLWLIQ